MKARWCSTRLNFSSFSDIYCLVNRFERIRLGSAWLDTNPLSFMCRWWVRRELQVKPVWKSRSEYFLTSHVFTVVNCHQNINLLSGCFFRMDLLYFTVRRRLLLLKVTILYVIFFIEEKEETKRIFAMKWSLHE